jgi:uncharacterized protein (UPF0332 family)
VKTALIESARRRLAQTKKRTRYVDLRRAISDSYYAIFHALCELCADELIGAKYRGSEEWRRLYRAILHKQAKEQLSRVSASQRDQRTKNFAAAFVEFQELRHSADYDPMPPKLKRASALDKIDEAEAAIREIGNVAVDERRWLAAFVLFKNRN